MTAHLLFLLTLQPNMGFGLFTTPFPGFSFFHNLAPISQFLSLNHLSFRPSGRIRIGFQPVIILTNFTSSILIRGPRHLILGASIHLLISVPFIKVCISLFFIINPFLH